MRPVIVYKSCGSKSVHPGTENDVEWAAFDNIETINVWLVDRPYSAGEINELFRS
jgi:hypothetical protein